MRSALFATFALGALWSAHAQPASALLCLPLTNCFCTVTATDLDIPDFDPLLTTSRDGEGQLSINCTGLSLAPTVIVSLDDGVWGNYTARKMRGDTGDLLSYNLYTTSQRTTVWGDGTSGTSTVSVTGSLINISNWSQTRAVFARATPQSTTKPGEYTDTIVVRIDF